MSNPARKPPKSSAERVADYRKRMRAAGFVPRTIWLPDTSDPAFIAEYDRQCRLVASRDEREADALMEALYAELDLGPTPSVRLPPEPK